MGRWGDKIYEGDAPLDYLLTITGRIERELAYWLSPEQVINSSHWLAQVLTVIEIMLLFEKRNMDSHIETKAVQRWREVFLNVWDDNWIDTYKYDYPYEEPDYRKQHRPAIISMFDHFESLAHDWTIVGNSTERPELTLLHSDYPLPYFSNNIERFTYDLLELLVKDIIYWLSAENRAEVITFNVEEVWVAVDVLGFLCEIYKQSPGVNEKVVRNWRETTVDIWKQNIGDDWNESYSLYQEVLAVFDRLEAVARKYPPVSSRG